MKSQRDGGTPASGSCRRLVVHVGMTKAGSTAIQNYLDLCRSDLVEKGVLFPKSGMARRNPFDLERTAGHLDLIRKIQSGDTQAFEEELSSANVNTVVLSAENLLLDRPDAELAALREYFAAWQISVVVVLRHPMDWLLSRYVESVTGGSSASVLTGVEFATNLVAHGGLRYAAALDRVKSALAAEKVGVLNYSAYESSAGIVGAFLEAAGLPMTRRELALSIRSNVREKHAILVEAKRRINHLTRKWPVEARLDLEAQIRRLAARLMSTSAATDERVDQTWVPVSEIALINAEASIAQLEAKYDLSLGFTLERQPVGRRSQQRATLRGLDEMTKATWMLAAAIGSRLGETNLPIQPGHRAALSCDGVEHLIDLLASSTFSVHVGSVDTSYLAASFSSKFPVYVPADAGSEKEIDGMIGASLPSDIVCVESTAMVASLIDSVSDGNALKVDVVVARDAAALAQVPQLLAAIETGALLVLVGNISSMMDSLVELLPLRIIASGADCVVLGSPSEGDA